MSARVKATTNIETLRLPGTIENEGESVYLSWESTPTKSSPSTSNPAKFNMNKSNLALSS